MSFVNWWSTFGVHADDKAFCSNSNIATVLITKGTLKVGGSIVSGQTWCRVRQITNDKGQVIKTATPGMPVIVTGWRDLPSAGDELLEAVEGEDQAKKAIENRKRDAERKALMKDVESINEKRRLERLRVEAEEEAAQAAKKAAVEMDAPVVTATPHDVKDDFKELRLIIRADVSGTVEAVVGVLQDIGNKEAGVKIVHTGVGDVTDSDVAMAEAAEGESVIEADILLRHHH